MVIGIFDDRDENHAILWYKFCLSNSK